MVAFSISHSRRSRFRSSSLSCRSSFLSSFSDRPDEYPPTEPSPARPFSSLLPHQAMIHSSMALRSTQTDLQPPVYLGTARIPRAPSGRFRGFLPPAAVLAVLLLEIPPFSDAPLLSPLDLGGVLLRLLHLFEAALSLLVQTNDVLVLHLRFLRFVVGWLEPVPRAGLEPATSASPIRSRRCSHLLSYRGPRPIRRPAPSIRTLPGSPAPPPDRRH